MPNRIITDGPNGTPISRSDAPHCPNCGEVMKVVSGPYGEFWGCLNYPHCRGKLPFEWKEEEGPTEDDIQRMIKEVWG